MLHKPKHSFNKSLAVISRIPPNIPACDDLVISLNQLLLYFNRYTFNSLFGILNFIWDFLEQVTCIQLYFEIVCQALTIFDLRLVYFKDPIKAMKKNKSWSIANQTKQVVKKILTPIAWHVRVNQTGKNYQKGAFSIITKHWGSDVTGFFPSCNKSEKCLRQIAHITCNYFLYFNTWHYVNAVVVERLIFGSSHHFGQYKTTTADQLA